MLVPTFVGVYLQIPYGITINMLAVIVCCNFVCVNFACCLVAFQNLADVKQFQLMMA